MTKSAKTTTRKQKRMSKHVIKAKEGSSQVKTTTVSASDTSDGLPVLSPKEKKPKKKKTKKCMKNPMEVASYLSAWKHRDAGGAWKFNKNTQSWLIRHMYEPEKVPKASFELLLEYLNALQNKDRLIEEAKRRALRYKEFEKTLGEKKEEGEKAEKEKVADVSKTTSTDEADENAYWERLSDHDKRKEYKRARKVLDTFQT